jgi:hypothetical protein
MFLITTSKQYRCQVWKKKEKEVGVWEEYNVEGKNKTHHNINIVFTEKYRTDKLCELKSYFIKEEKISYTINKSRELYGTSFILANLTTPTQTISHKEFFFESVY